ncbi:beta-lactamase-like protein 2 homolog [Tribolium madens]|uniref:beta-lactamase-like protein 2 homolog n=1 Tax=Tribolium madens TaxID=41895 RepID=UPI001CF7301D|nr:beta-lactamase-like protein 2 homolog [Tribolium madens]
MAAVIPAVTKLSARIIRVLGCNPGIMTLQGTNTYIIGTGKRRILVDTGDADVPQYINHLKSVLKHEDIDLAHIFISHWHHDHMGGLLDVLDLKDKTKYTQVWKYPRSEGESLPDGCTIDFLKDGQEFSVEGATVRVVHTPGHTTDHIVLHLVEENAVFSGDCVLGEGTAVFEDLYDYMNSLQEIADLEPAVVYPGHGNVIHSPKEKIEFYIQHRKEREQQILNILINNRQKQFNEMELVKMIYTDTPEKLLKAAESNVNHHLVKLLKDNKVAQFNNLWQYNDTCKTI